LNNDIPTSLPLGDGAYYTQRKDQYPGAFRHIKSDVTVVRNKTFTKRWLFIHSKIKRNKIKFFICQILCNT